MSRGKRGKLKPLDSKQKLAKAVRNEQRKRVPKAVKWEKEHVKRGNVFTGLTLPKSKRKQQQEAMTAAVVQALNELPAVEEAKVK